VDIEQQRVRRAVASSLAVSAAPALTTRTRPAERASKTRLTRFVVHIRRRAARVMGAGRWTSAKQPYCRKKHTNKRTRRAHGTSSVVPFPPWLRRFHVASHPPLVALFACLVLLAATAPYHRPPRTTPSTPINSKPVTNPVSRELCQRG